MPVRARYASLLTMQIMLQKIWSNNHWTEQIRSLVRFNSHLPFGEIGFPDDWEARKERRFAP